MTITRFLGRQARLHNALIPSAHQVCCASLQLPIPAAKTWLTGLPPSLGMMLNDSLGDCTVAAVYHAIQLWTFNTTGQTLTEPDPCVLQLYEEACGYRGTPDTDNGGIEQNVLSYLLNTGAPLLNNQRHKIAAFVEIDPRNIQDVKRAIAEGGVVYLGIQIPEAWCQMPVGSDWTDASGPIAGGHAIVGGGYDDDWIYIVSWGSIWRMSWGAFAQVCDEAYLIADPFWLTSKGLTPFGMSLSALETSMQGIRLAA
jgi:hypothetical protein